MQITRFKTLLAIAELGTFAEAAESVHRTPAAVSQQMKSLEEELGVTLFDRSKRPAELNPAGYALVPRAQELVTRYEAMRIALHGNSHPVERLVVGSVPTTMPGLIPETLKAMKEAATHLHVRVYRGLSEELYTQVDRGILDAAIVTEPRKIHAHLDWCPLAEEPFVVVASKELEDNDPIRLLQTHPFIRLSRRALVGRMIDDWLLENKVDIREAMETETLEWVAAMVFHKLGVSIIPTPCCLPVAIFPLKTLPLPRSKPRVLGVLSRQETSKGGYIDLLRQSIARIVKAAGARESH